MSGIIRRNWLEGGFCINYIGNLFIFSSIFEEHLEYIETDENNFERKFSFEVHKV